MGVDDFAARLADGDPSIFVGTTALHSLGWLRHADQLGENLARWQHEWFVARPPRHTRTLLLGMGGSSVSAGMFAGLVGSDQLKVLDTSNPDTISGTSFEGVNVMASSKSGTTVETITTLAWALAHGLAERDLTIITDPGSPLAQLGEFLGAQVFYGDPDCGGRFSSLSAFGLVPALAAGWTPEELLASGFGDDDPLSDVARWCAEGQHFALTRDFVGWYPLNSAPRSRTSELWLEQLVAESTGKQGRGIIPIVDDAGSEITSRHGVVRDVLAHHVRVAAMANSLGVDPFNQPDVEEAKLNVFSVLRDSREWRPSTVVDSSDMGALDEAAYVALQVFGPLELDEHVENLRRTLNSSFERVTAGIGPRFLHSTGQLHKGGPNGVVAVQVCVRPRSEPERISGRNYSFHDLHDAQARADAQALRAAGRRVIELRVESLDEVAPALGR